MPVNKIQNTGLSNDARVFSLSSDIFEPVEGQAYNVMVRSPFPFEIIDFWHQVDAGSLEAEVRINGIQVSFAGRTSADLETGGNPIAEATNLHGYKPDSSDPDDYTVPDPNVSSSGAAKLQIVLDNFDSDAPALYSYAFTCRRLKSNVPE